MIAKLPDVDDRLVVLGRSLKARMEEIAKLKARMEGGEVLQSVVWDVPAGLTKGAQSNTNTHATVWLSGGVNGIMYEIQCHATMSSGVTKSKTVILHVRDK